MSPFWRRVGGRPAPMTPAEQALAERLGLDRVRVLHGMMDGRTPLTTISLEGSLRGARRSAVTRQAAVEVLHEWPGTADLVSVFLTHDPAADPFTVVFGRAQLEQGDP